MSGTVYLPGVCNFMSSDFSDHDGLSVANFDLNGSIPSVAFRLVEDAVQLTASFTLMSPLVPVVP